jgi:hypothetical protein
MSKKGAGMAEEGKGSAPREFLVVALPEQAETGATLRLLGVAGTQSAAEKLLADLDPKTLGRVALLERKALYVRQPAVETVEVGDAIVKK